MSMGREIRILGLCGSLRRASRSGALLCAAQQLMPLGAELRPFKAVGELPLFNPDIDPLPPAVAQLWRESAACDALLIASPEYAHGVTGVLKNALDWLVAHPALPGKPVGVFNPAARAVHADAALKEILRTMSLSLVEPACVCVDVLTLEPTADAVRAAADRAATIGAALAALCAAGAAERPRAP